MMDATQAKAPAPKMRKRATFSRFGRWMERSVLKGRPRIQMSVMMLNVEVAGTISFCGPDALRDQFLQ